VYGLIEWKMDLELGQRYHMTFTIPAEVKYAETPRRQGLSHIQRGRTAADTANRTQAQATHR
jgi:hypothetical protein